MSTSARRTARGLALAAAAAALAACSSPEADRVRGGGSGADPLNVGDVVRMHAGSRPYWDTPCRGGPAPCPEPEPVHEAARR